MLEINPPEVIIATMKAVLPALVIGFGTALLFRFALLLIGVKI